MSSQYNPPSRDPKLLASDYDCDKASIPLAPCLFENIFPPFLQGIVSQNLPKKQSDEEGRGVAEGHGEVAARGTAEAR
jgi:hypothetical protein